MAGPGKDGKEGEFAELARAAGYNVVDVIRQRRTIDSRFYVGSGKLMQVKQLMADRGVTHVITYDKLKPSQFNNLRRELKVNVMDRVQLILEIFNERAGDMESKLQVRLAELYNQLPLLREYVRHAKRGEQIGFMGLGEYAIDAYYKHVLKQIAVIRRRLDELMIAQADRIRRRKEVGMPQVAITGYTMAGKTSLFNLLARESKGIDGRPFATLSTYSRLVSFHGKRAILTDTIGFIDDLPPLLIKSFYATISEVTYADVVLLVVDASEEDAEIKRKLSVSLNVFDSLAVNRQRVLAVMNKIDLLSPADLSRINGLASRFGLRFVDISAKMGIGIDELKSIVGEMLEDYVTVKLRGDVPEWAFKVATVLGSDGDGLTLLINKVYLPKLSKEAKIELIRNDVSD
ncbi:GTPase HflX [Thermocladium modestius]|uniref:GTPase HflX n=2 Tax=Thermocladium modestius TaxID=62609 RepID=A0A830GWW3_9CREN|nr:GTPase HflX [Thermocladium modestius]